MSSENGKEEERQREGEEIEGRKEVLVDQAKIEELRDFAKSFSSVLDHYKCKSLGALPRDVSENIRDCFLTLAHIGEQNIRTGFHGKNGLLLLMQSHMIRFTLDELKTQSRAQKVNIKSLKAKYSSELFNSLKEKLIADRILDMAQPNKEEMRENFQLFTVYIFKLSGYDDEEIVSSFAKAALKRRPEDGLLETIGLTGWGKWTLPVYRQLMIINGITIYVVVKDCILQFVDSFFDNCEMEWVGTDGVELTVPPSIWFPRPLNPDYYARIAGACFDVIWQPLASYSKDQFKQFIIAVIWAHRKGPSEENAVHSVSEAEGMGINEKFLTVYLKKFSRAKQMYNSSAFLPGINFLYSSKNSRGSFSNYQEQPQIGAPRKRPSMLVNSNRGEGGNNYLQANSADDYFKALEGESPLRLVVAEPSTAFCTKLWKEFSVTLEGLKDKQDLGALDKNYTIVNDSYESLGRDRMNATEEERVALVVYGNAFGKHDDQLVQLIAYFGHEIVDRIQARIRRRFFGEMPLFSSLIVPLEHPIYDTIVYVCSRISFKNKNAFECMWSALCAVQSYNRDNCGPFSRINVMVTPGLWMYGGDIIKTSTSKMVKAWLRWKSVEYSASRNGNHFVDVPKGNGAMHHEHFVLDKETSTKSEDEVGSSWFIEHLLNGEIDKRGFLDESELTFLCNLLKPSPPPTQTTPPTSFSTFSSALSFSAKAHLMTMSGVKSAQQEELGIRIAAAKTIAKYSFIEGDSNAIQIVYDSGLPLDVFLSFVSRNDIQCVRKIPKEDLILDPTPFVLTPAGSYHRGKLKIGENEFNYKEVAVKVRNSSDKPLDLIKHELSLLTVLRSPNIVRCYGAVFEGLSVRIVTEFVSAEDLSVWIRREQNSDIDWPTRTVVALQMAMAVDSLHSKNIVHRDLKCSSFMIDSANTLVKMTELISAGSTSGWPKEPEVYGMPAWVAPEIVNKKPYTTATDVFCFGGALWELASRKHVSLFHHEKLDIPREWPKDYANLVRGCCHSIPSKRLAIKEVVAALQKQCGDYHIYLDNNT